MTIDCTLDALKLAYLPAYSNEFGTKKSSGGLTTSECADDAMLPFRKMRPYEVSETSETTEIQHNAVFVVKTSGITLTLHDGSSDFLGCEARILNVSGGDITVKGGTSGLDGGTSGITVPSKRETRLIWLSDGWHSSYANYANVTTKELADSCVSADKIAGGAVTTAKFAAGATAPLAGKISKTMSSNQTETFLEGSGSTDGFSLKWSTGEDAGDLVLEMTDDANSQFRIKQNSVQVLQAINGKCNINGAAQVLSQAVFNSVYPVGVTYVQYPQQASPNDLWGSFSTWTVIDYGGAFFRAQGGNANSFIEKSGVLSMQAGQNKSHSHSGSVASAGSHTHTRGTMDITGYIGDLDRWRNTLTNLGDNAFYPAGTVLNSNGKSGDSGNIQAVKFQASRTWTGETSSSGSHTHSLTINSDGGNEARPSNYTVRVWKRTS